MNQKSYWMVTNSEECEKKELTQSLCEKNTTPNSKLQTNLTYNCLSNEHEETKIRKNQTDIN